MPTPPPLPRRSDGDPSGSRVDGSGDTPLAADGMRAPLAPGNPASDVDLLEVELEQRVMRDRLDHPADLGPHHDRPDHRPRRRIAGDLAGGSADAELVVVGTR